MTRPVVPQIPINEAIFNTLLTTCMQSVELMPETQAIIEEQDELIERFENKDPQLVKGQLQDISMALACRFGEEMFKLGIALGRNPAAILDIPDTFL